MSQENAEVVWSGFDGAFLAAGGVEKHRCLCLLPDAVIYPILVPEWGVEQSRVSRSRWAAGHLRRMDRQLDDFRSWR